MALKTDIREKCPKCGVVVAKVGTATATPEEIRALLPDMIAAATR